MTDLLARDWKALLLCGVLAALVWFLVNEGRVQPVPAIIPGSPDGLPSDAESP